MPRTETALITPEVLAWARRNAGYENLERPAKAIQWPPERLEAVERGEQTITLAKARTLAERYDVPLAVFYLPTPPADEARPVDRRSTDAGRLPPGLVRCVRQAAALRLAILDLAAEMEHDLPDFPVMAQPDEPPAAVASRIRAAVVPPGRPGLRTWIDAVEEAGVSVQQFPGRLMESASGFSLAERPMPVVGLNQRHSPTRRVFTLFHELAHIALRTDGVCDLDFAAHRDMERFCDRVAAAVLLPHADVVPIASAAASPEAAVRDVASTLGVSEEATLYRLRDLGLVTDDDVRRLRMQFRRDRPARRGGGGPSPVVRQLTRLGRTASRTIATAYEEGRIGLTDALRLAGVKAERMGEFVDRALTGGSA